MRPWKLAELTYAHVKQQQYEVAVIPPACTRPHILQVPYGTDSLEAEVIGAAKIDERFPFSITSTGE